MTAPSPRSGVPPDPTSAGSTAASSNGSAGYERSRDIGEVSVGQLIGDISKDLSTLMRQEMELAKAEITTEVSKTAQGAGMLGGAGFAGYMVALFLSIALWWGLANVMDQGWAALIVAVLWGVIGAVLFVVGRGKLR